MPLPRSLTCSSCQHTYPDGWKRCPYCGFDPEKEKRDRQIERALVKRFPSYAASVKPAPGSASRKPQSRRTRGQERPPAPDAGRNATPADMAEAERKRSRRRRGRRRRGPGSTPERPTEGQTPQAREPRKRRQDPEAGVRDAGAPTTDREKTPQTTPDSTNGTETQARRTRRRRPRRRRKPQDGGGEPSSSS